MSQVDEHEIEHGHSHAHAHHNHSANNQALFISFLFITGFMIVEAVGGFWSHSLTLLSDAGHMLSDAVSLGLSFIALVVGVRASANNNKTFGYKRFEILAALFNGVLLLVISIGIIIEAIRRFIRPEAVASIEMLIVAVIGMIVNVLVAWILAKGDTSGNLNMKSAFLHVISDLIGSIGAVCASLIIYFFHWNYADPIASIVVSSLILRSGWRVTKEAINILMEGRPEDINTAKIRHRLLDIPGVYGLHDLHVWTITSDFPSLSCHLVVDDGIDRDQLLREVETCLKEFHLRHTTVQVEGKTFSDCHSDCEHHG